MRWRRGHGRPHLGDDPKGGRPPRSLSEDPKCREAGSILWAPNHDPKKATVWKTIDDPQQVVAVLQARNQKHFRQAKGTPFTTGDFGTIPFDGSGPVPVADAVLDGTYKSSDPVTIGRARPTR
jgi:hypothetical protein